MKIWQLMTEGLLFVDTPTCRINNICNQHMLHSVDALCYYNLMQHHNAFNNLNFLQFWDKNSRLPFLSAAYQVCCSITLYLILDKQDSALCMCLLYPLWVFLITGDVSVIDIENIWFQRFFLLSDCSEHIFLFWNCSSNYFTYGM